MKLGGKRWPVTCQAGLRASVTGCGGFSPASGCLSSSSSWLLERSSSSSRPSLRWCCPRRAPARRAAPPRARGASRPAPGGGFRVHETALGISNDTVGRTHAVTGTIAVSGPNVTAAAFRIGLTAITVGGKTQPQFATSLGTRQYPVATFTLTQPVTLGSAFASGATITATATGQLTMRGISHLVTVTISGRRNGSALQVAGSIPIAFSDWGITGPKGYGFFGSLANHGVAEFLLVLHRH